MGPFDIERDLNSPAVGSIGIWQRARLACLIEFGETRRIWQVVLLIEEVQGVQGAGATSAFTFGFGAGLLEGILIAARRPYMKVRPQVWTKALGVARDKGDHRQLAQRLYPESAHLFARVKDDGRADAALIAYWWGAKS